jgi:hypothetical protein
MNRLAQRARDFCTRREPWLVLAFAVLLFVANVATARGFPNFTDDDALMSDPGVNLALGRGFTSAAWFGQTKEELFSGNLPLYPLLLAGWLKLFGLGHLQLRTFGYLCGSLSVVLVWWAVRRQRWITSAWARLSYIVPVFLAWPAFIAYRRNRYDATQMLLCSVALAVWASSLRPPLKRALLLVLGVLTACAGFQAGGYLAILCTLAVVWQGRRVVAEAIATVAGVAAGAGGMFCFLWANGILHGLLANKRWVKLLEGETAANLWRSRLDRVVLDSFRDAALMALFALLLVLLSQRYARWSWAERRRVALWAGGLTMAIILGLETVLHFITCYRWMTLLPLGLLVVAALERAAPELTPLRRGAVIALLAAMAGFGLIGAEVYGGIRGFAGQFGELETIAARELRPTDVAFAEYATYCAVKPRVALAYFPGYLEQMSPREEAEVNVLLYREQHRPSWYTLRFGEFRERFSRQGQKWRKVGQLSYPRTPAARAIAHFLPGFVDRLEMRTNLYEVSVFRREE